MKEETKYKIISIWLDICILATFTPDGYERKIQELIDKCKTLLM